MDSMSVVGKIQGTAFKDSASAVGSLSFLFKQVGKVPETEFVLFYTNLMFYPLFQVRAPRSL